MRFAVVVFPGSNCDADCFHVVQDVLGESVESVWHQASDLAGFDCVILPGGFSYGDYLRAGAIARFSPVMRAVADFAQTGGPVLGICNGFQVLCEAGLLPGALHQNSNLRFQCRPVHVRIERTDTPFTSLGRAGDVLQLPIAHAQGSYFADEQTLRELNAHNQVVFRYCLADGTLAKEANPNGSLELIAGISNRAGNVVGMMPHPERNAEALLGDASGRVVFESIVHSLTGRGSSKAPVQG